MADSATTHVGAQAQAVGDDLLNELQAAVSAKPAAMPAEGFNPKAVSEIAARARSRITQAGEDAYWGPRRQMEQAIAGRTAQAVGQEVADRIAKLKQQIGAAS